MLNQLYRIYVCVFNLINVLTLSSSILFSVWYSYLQGPLSPV